MTEGEKMVWAAAFALGLRDANCLNAAEDAAHALDALQDARAEAANHNEKRFVEQIDEMLRNPEGGLIVANCHMCEGPPHWGPYSDGETRGYAVVHTCNKVSQREKAFTVIEALGLWNKRQEEARAALMYKPCRLCGSRPWVILIDGEYFASHTCAKVPRLELHAITQESLVEQWNKLQTEGEDDND